MKSFSQSRRDFLSALSVAAAFFPGRAGAEMLRAAAKRTAASSADWSRLGLILAPVPNRLMIFDAASHAFSFIPVPNLMPHSLLHNPGNPRLALVIDQSGTAATLVNLAEKKVLRQLQSSPGNTFTGHGAFSADGKLLFLPEYAPPETGKEGVLSLYDGLTLEHIRDLPPHGKRPHSLMLLKQETVLALSHEGSMGAVGEPRTGGCMVFLDAKSGELIEKVVPAEPYLFPNHFDLDADETIAISTQSFYQTQTKDSVDPVTKDLLTPLLIGKMGAKKWASVMPPKLKARMKHNHSIVVDKIRHRALVAHSKGQLVGIWDLATHEAIHTFDCGKDNPVGVAIGGKNKFYVIGTSAGNFLIMDADSFRVLETIDGSKGSPMNGQAAAHISVLAGLG
ncbi:MAG: DUF1513 domain-containing protein [Bdellovibrionota bacterium]